MNSEKNREREFLRKCEEAFDYYKRALFMRRRDETGLEVSDEFYKELKQLSSIYYDGEDLPYNYRYLAEQILSFERMVEPNYILPMKSHDFSRILDKPVSSKNDEIILDYIVDQTRNFLYDKIALDRSIFPFEKYDLQDKCVIASEFIIDCVYKLGFSGKTIVIYPCFQKNSGVMFGGVHVFTLVNIDDRMYLVDCTYSQFFTKSRCNLERLGVPLMVGCAPGTFMIYDEFYKEVATTILNRGWIEFTDEVAKAYLDGFLLSYRNGLYYERTGDFSFTTKYTTDDYEKFIYREDNLFNYEKKEEMGYQLKPLKNPNFQIKYKP